MRKPTCRSRPRLGGDAPVGRDLRAVGADLEEEAALVGRLAGAQILDLDRVRGDALLAVEDLDLDEVRAPDLRARRAAAGSTVRSRSESSLITPETTMSDSSIPSSR